MRTRFDLIRLSEKGVTKDLLLRLADYIGLTISQIVKIVPVTERTIQRYGRRQRFNKVVSEQIIQMTEVVGRGVDVFGSREKFLYWLKSPCPAFGNRNPSSLLSSRFGSELVLDELGRIEHGIVG